MSTIGAKVHRIPSADASRAACRAASSISSGFQDAACPSGIGKIVLYPWITSLPNSSGIPRRVSFVRDPLRLRPVGRTPAFRNEPHRPARISALIWSEMGVAMAVDCDIWPIFSSRVILERRVSIRFSTSIADCADSAAARNPIAASHMMCCIDMILRNPRSRMQCALELCGASRRFRTYCGVERYWTQFR